MNMEEAAGSNKVMGIRQIVRLREILHKWQSLTIGAKANNNNNNKERPSIEHHGGIPPEVSRQLRLSDAIIDSDEEYGCRTPEPPHGVPKGYLAVYVGPELRRFIIPTSYLSDPLFKVLLEKVEEEFGFDHSGALTIPCETETFKYLLKCMENHQKENNIDINAETSQSHQRSESPERSASPERRSASPERSESPARCESPERTESPETSLPPADE